MKSKMEFSPIREPLKEIQELKRILELPSDEREIELLKRNNKAQEKAKQFAEYELSKLLKNS